MAGSVALMEAFGSELQQFTLIMMPSFQCCGRHLVRCHRRKVAIHAGSYVKER